jgi:hypothetical protein
MQLQEVRSPKTLVEGSVRLAHEIADLLSDAAETSKSDFHTERLRRLSEGFRSLDAPLTKIAGHLEH